MLLHALTLQHFRNYTQKTIHFKNITTVIVGPNAAGKTNFLESIKLLSTGKSFKAEKDSDLLAFKQDIARVKGKIDEGTLEVVVTSGVLFGREAPFKKYLVNDIPKRRTDFAGNLPSVSFLPTDIEIVIGSPGKRRDFLDDVLEQIDRDYRVSLHAYQKALRQRNALLEHTRETGRRNEKEFEYWDTLLIDNGSLVSKKRKDFITFLNDSKKDIFSFNAHYDESAISKERLDHYKDREVGAGNTLVGPHRDDILFYFDKKEEKELKQYGSRGQQRMVVLQLKILQLAYMENILSKRPLLLLDDIFSELDDKHIDIVISMLGKQQTILTTTHNEFLTELPKEESQTIEIGK